MTRCFPDYQSDMSRPMPGNVRLSKSPYDLPLFFHTGCAIGRQPRDRSPIVESDFHSGSFQALRQQEFLSRWFVGFAGSLLELEMFVETEFL